MRAAPADQKLQWCQRIATSFAAPELDVSRNSMMVRTIMDFKSD